MAQTGFTPISIYYSSTASATPTAGNLVAGELAINTADGKLFYKDSSGVVQTIASKAGNVNVSSFSGGTTGLTPSTATTGVVTLAGTLAVANGGTNLTSVGASGNVLTSNGTTWTSAAVDGAAKAWVNFNGSSPTVRASYNISSVTRASAGQYTVNFTNAFSDTNYAVVANASTTQSNTYVVIGVYTPSNNSYSSKTTTSVAINAYSPAVSNYDPFEVDVAFFR